ncbi:hypothetical protein PIB30_118166 [Stylosanthes scabra]|uniref:Uncharacterized protein n=1 Tax=Stylosanthes scabra TaxID=79078 RepID=A0ABU6SII9_9FABA|nr:hypothetical protein [Stylosanthes scabra]
MAAGQPLLEPPCSLLVSFLDHPCKPPPKPEAVKQCRHLLLFPSPPAPATIHRRSLKQRRLLLFSFSDRPASCMADRRASQIVGSSAIADRGSQRRRTPSQRLRTRRSNQQRPTPSQQRRCVQQVSTAVVEP